MIKIFRRIRQRLLSENKFNKYLIYAIGEIILVVIGILIALQINNWNESQKTIKKETIILNDFASALKQDLEHSINPLIQTLEQRYAYTDSLITLFGNTKRINNDQLEYFRALMFGLNYTWEITAYENFKSEGAGIIRDKNKRNALIEIYNGNYPQLQLRVDNFMNNLIEYYRPYMRMHFYFDYQKDGSTRYIPLNIEALQLDPVFHNTLVTARMNFKNILGVAKTTKLKVNSTLKLIEGN